MHPHGSMPRGGRPLVILALVLAAAPSLADDNPASWVDPFIGTGGHGHTHPAATLPFGMVQLGPDTRLEGWDGCSGYHHTDSVVYGFSHTHLSGTGISDYGDILFMPMTGIPTLHSGYERSPDAGYASRFDKSTERAGPGWYAVELADHGISVELTATERTGFHRYRYPEGARAFVIVDLKHRDETIDSALRLVGQHEIEGYRRSTGWADEQVVYFVARFSRAINGSSRNYSGPRPAEGDSGPGGRKAAFLIDEPGGELLIKVGISAVDIEGARRNLDAESPGWDFDAVRDAARDRWNEALGRIKVRGGTDEQRTIFYTALYHALLAPNLFSDVDGRYRGLDREIHHAEGRRHYTVFSLWDTFRTAHPLYTLIEPERTVEFIETMLSMYRQGGRLPVWELAANETDTMIGYHAVPVIADAWLKGIRSFDAEAALEAMVHSAGLDHFGLEAYKRQGFIGGDDAGESVSRTLEYAFDDACIARMARDLGQGDMADGFARRSQGWRHLLDPESGFMRPRINQRWLDPFDPRRVDNHFTEANSWQYSFFVPHDVEGLIDALGGEDSFVERLDALFDETSETTGRDQADITGLIGQYAHGNEPSHHMAWLYHYAGRPDKSAERVREILDTLYTVEPDGLSGNEDCGQMSAWYVMSALGIYPVCPCDDEYVLGAPIFERATIRPDGGGEFTIVAKGAEKGHRYVGRARLNGKALHRSALGHGEITAGGRLELTLSPRPGRKWGREAQDRPVSRGEGEPVLAAPYAISATDRFRDELTVELASADENAAILYTLAPTTDATEWIGYEEPLRLTESTWIQFAAEQGERRSPVVEVSFHRIPHDWSIEVHTEPNPQYTAGGPEALIDGLRGKRDWRLGGWQGFQHTDFEATVDLGEPRPLRRVGASFLQDVRSWIWMPGEVVVSISPDGEQFHEIARLKPEAAAEQRGVILEELAAEIVVPVEARHVRVLARNYGTIPDWHPGRGDGAFIFVDEIVIE